MGKSEPVAATPLASNRKDVLDDLYRGTGGGEEDGAAESDADGLWLLFDNGRQKAAVNIGRPGPIVRRAILGWYRQAKGTIAAAEEKSP